MSDERVGKLAAVYQVLADTELHGYCPLYERIAHEMARDDAQLTTFVDAIERVGLLPVLLFACVHDLVLDPSQQDDALVELGRIYAGGDGDPWPPFRAVLGDHRDTLLAMLRTHAVQTNEVGRTAAVLPALTALHAHVERPIALVELGPSAGLNLFLDRYAIDYGDGRRVGDPEATVQLTCECRGDLVPPLPTEPLPIVRREGIDLNPIDVTRPDDRRWLDACIWPGLDVRRQRLQAAMAIAQADPPHLHRGNALDLLAEVVKTIEADALPCIVSTWVLSYLSPDERVQLERVLDELGAVRELAMITGEYPKIVPWLDVPTVLALTDDPRGASLLGLTTWRDGHREATPVAWMHAHGRWLHWIDRATAA